MVKENMDSSIKRDEDQPVRPKSKGKNKQIPEQTSPQFEDPNPNDWSTSPYERVLTPGTTYHDDHSHGNQDNVNTEETLEVGQTEKTQDPTGSQSDEDEQEHTLSSLTPKSHSTSLKSPHSTSSFNNYISTLNQRGQEENQAKNHVEAFKIFMGGQE